MTVANDLSPEAGYAAFFNHAVEGIFRTSLDGRYLAANPALARIYGYESPEALASGITAIREQLYVDPNRRAEFLRLINEEGVVRGFESEIRRRDGTVVWISENARAISDDDGAIVCFEGTVLDITARVMAERALRDSEEQYRRFVDGAQNAIIVWSQFGMPVFFNGAALDLLGCARDEFTARSVLEFVPTDERDAVANEIADAFEAGRLPEPAVRRLISSSGAPLTVQLSTSLVREGGAVVGLWCEYRDVTAEHAAIAEALRARAEDETTGLLSRAEFVTRAQEALDAGPATLLFVDIDRFHVVNDTLGRDVGDRVLAAWAARLRQVVAEVASGALMSRHAGDEFLVLVDAAAEHSGSASAAEAILEGMKQPFIVDTPEGEHELFLTCSVGLAHSSDDARDVERLLQRAERAMRGVKNGGSGGVAAYRPTDRPVLDRRLQLEGQLHRAVYEGALEVHFQPIVGVREGRVVGAEALLRWFHPELGAIPASTFVPMLEETGLVQIADSWARREALSQLLAWDRAGTPGLFCAVNMSALDLSDRAVTDRIIADVEASGIAVDRLELEVTETAVMLRPHAAKENLHDLADAGFHLSLDDFGVGYSSLSRLHELPVRKLKIDRSFVTALPADPARKMVEGVIALGHALKLTVVAEGVERPDQRSFLADAGVDQLQGFIYSRAVPGASFLGVAEDCARRGSKPAAA